MSAFGSQAAIAAVLAVHGCSWWEEDGRFSGAAGSLTAVPRRHCRPLQAGPAKLSCISMEWPMHRLSCSVGIGVLTIVITRGAVAGPSNLLPPAAYIDPTDQLIVRTGEGVPGRPFPCAREKTEQGISVIERMPTDKCFRMLPAQRWRGLWRNNFEGSQFCAAPAVVCDYHSPGERVWLNADRVRGRRGALYSLQFVGRKTMYTGPYGHMGMSDQEIIVDRVISIKMVQAPPPPMTKAQLIQEWRRCKAAGTCMTSKEMRAMMKGGKWGSCRP